MPCLEHKPTIALYDLPLGAQIDWDAIADEPTKIGPEDFENIDLRADLDEEESEASEENDDNPYQESDEALPDDAEERAIRDQLAKNGGGSI